MSVALMEPATRFQDSTLNPTLLAVLDRIGYATPTPIQAALIPEALAGRDIIGQAQTGTGKTAAFLLPILHGLRDDAPGPQALVLAPTRELALQIVAEADKLSEGQGLRAVAVYGGERMRTQLDALRRGCHLAIGTPGRIIDHLGRGTLKLEHLRYVVLDEADRMLDIGFRPDIEKILRRCPKDRQTFLLSATLPPPVRRLAQRYMRHPVMIDLSPTRLAVENVRQTYITVEGERKFDLLLKVIEREHPRQCIIFCRTKRGADRLYSKLREAHQKVATIHGDLPQDKRTRIMTNFRRARITFLVATDVVGRGIDVTNISHIINYDCPEDPESYVHRIGRTGRMGADGSAITFVTPEEGDLLTAIENLMNSLVLEDRIEGFQAFARQSEPEQAKEPEPAQPVFGRRVKRYRRAL